MLGIARVAGETAPLLVLVGYSQSTNRNPFSSNQGSLPGMIYDQSANLGSSFGLNSAGQRVKLHNYAADRMWGAALTLILIVMALNLIARLAAGAAKSSRCSTTHPHAPPQRRTRSLMAKRIDAKNLNIYYGKFKAVSDVNLTIEPRSVTAFIGPSGCGKSTVLRTLNRLHEVIAGARVEGEVLLDGEDIYGNGSIRSTSVAPSAWSSSGRTRSRRCRSTRTSWPGSSCRAVASPSPT